MQTVSKFLWQSIKPYKWYYLIMIIAPIAGAFYKPIVFYTMKLMVDIISSPNGFNSSQLIKPVVIYLITDISLTMFWRVSNIACWRSEPYVKRSILLTALDKVLSFKYIFFLNTSGGSITSKIKGLLEGYSNTWAQMYYGLLFWIVASITSAFSIFWVNLYLGLIVVIYAGIFILVNLLLAKKVDYLSMQENESKHTAIGLIADSISNVQSIKYYANRKYEYERLNEYFSANYVPREQASIKLFFKINLFNDFFSIVVFLLMLIVMIKLKSVDLISNGDFVFVFGIVMQFQENLWHLIQEYNTFARQTGDLKSSLNLYTASTNEYAQNIKTNNFNLVTARIEFKDVNFAYDANQPIFTRLNFTINAGEKIGIVGYTGAGKSTLVNLLIQTFIPQQGSILINDIDIKTINNDNLRQLIALIPQDINLFHRSLMDNIRYGNLNATDEEVISAAKLAHVDEFVSKLPDKYNTLVGERGVKLSGGQRQRIAIARAILKNSPILILDEATSSLDSITEQYIQESIKEAIVGKTVIAIAHRLSTLLDMNKIIVFDKGHIVESGTHYELVANPNSMYAKIWQTQILKDI